MVDSQAYPGRGTTVDANDPYNVQRYLFDQMMDGVSTAIPVKVVAVGENGTRVDVQPMVNQLDGGGKAIPHGTVNNLLVWQYRAGGNAIELLPQVGDKGLAVFCHSDISSVKANKDTANPGSLRKFDYADGVYLGGLWGPDVTQYVRLDDTGVTIQAASGQPVTLGSDQGVTTDTGYQVNGTQVVGPQGSAVPDPTGGGTVDTQARATLVALLGALRTHGLIAS